jgi:xylulokinase
MTAQTSRADLVQAVLEGVAFSFVDGKDCLANAGTLLNGAGIIGGGARSRLWAKILAGALALPLTRYEGADKGPAFGAARLARLAAAGEAVEDVCKPPKVQEVILPDVALAEAYGPRVESFRRLYRALRPEFRASVH